MTSWYREVADIVTLQVELAVKSIMVVLEY